MNRGGYGHEYSPGRTPACWSISDFMVLPRQAIETKCLFDVSLHPGPELTYRQLNSCPHSSSAIAFTLRVDTPCTYISSIAATSALSFADTARRPPHQSGPVDLAALAIRSGPPASSASGCNNRPGIPAGSRCARFCSLAALLPSPLPSTCCSVSSIICFSRSRSFPSNFLRSSAVILLSRYPAFRVT
jgi:hypothetical protein